jgi:hypothetical protein
MWGRMCELSSKILFPLELIAKDCNYRLGSLREDGKGRVPVSPLTLA